VTVIHRGGGVKTLGIVVYRGLVPPPTGIAAAFSGPGFIAFMLLAVVGAGSLLAERRGHSRVVEILDEDIAPQHRSKSLWWRRL
jgi:hypothetical protein